MGVFSVLRRIHIPYFHAKKRLTAKEKAFLSYEETLKRDDGYIEHQLALSALRFGSTTAAKAGCEVIAVYNALRDRFGVSPASLPRLLSMAERNGIALRGLFGTSPDAIPELLGHFGVPARLSLAMPEDASRLIVSFYNDRDNIFRGIHTVYFSRTDVGWIAHNAHPAGVPVGPLDSPQALFRKKRKPLSYIALP